MTYAATPGLLYDESREEYRYDGKPITRVSTIVQGSGVAQDYFGVDPDVLARAAARGRALHHAVDLHFQGRLDPNSVHENILGHFLDVLDCINVTRFKYHAGETILASRRHGYAGRNDLLGFVTYDRVLWDLKNTAACDRAGLELQTAGYQILWEENFNERIQKRAGLWIPSSGTLRRRTGWRLIPCEHPDARSMFLAALWMQQHPDDPACVEIQEALGAWAQRLTS